MNSTETPKPAHGPSAHGAPKAEAPDVNEYGAEKNGVRQQTSKRLFMQLLVYTGCSDPQKAASALRASGLESVLYLDVNDPKGIGVLFMGEDPSIFTDRVRKILTQKPFSQYIARQEFTMLGRTYSTGFEQDLEDWILQKPRRNAFNESLNWVVWYPLRRKGEFETLPKEEQRAALMEHAKLGMAYGQADLAHDIRLACHGIDKSDNEFVLGLLAHDLGVISKLVQDMRKTQQTSRYIQSMGPFFVGKVFFRNKNSR